MLGFLKKNLTYISELLHHIVLDEQCERWIDSILLKIFGILKKIQAALHLLGF